MVIQVVNGIISIILVELFIIVFIILLKLSCVTNKENW